MERFAFGLWYIARPALIGLLYFDVRGEEMISEYQFITTKEIIPILLQMWNPFFCPAHWHHRPRSYGAFHDIWFYWVRSFEMWPTWEDIKIVQRCRRLLGCFVIHCKKHSGAYIGIGIVYWIIWSFTFVVKTSSKRIVLFNVIILSGKPEYYTFFLRHGYAKEGEGVPNIFQGWGWPRH